ncbi:Nn.00g068420.m01.CDS01 [Neocucurbitaria sp. VM-36]
MRIASVAALVSHRILTIAELSKADTGTFNPSPPSPKGIDRHYRVDALHGDSIRLRPRDFDPDEPADQETWEYFVLKGGALMCAMRNSDKFAGEWLNDARTPPSAASVWQGDLKQELTQWGWNDLLPLDSLCSYGNDGYWELEEAFKNLGLNPHDVSKGGHNECYRIEHWNPNLRDANNRLVPAEKQEYRIGERRYRATGAAYSFGMNRIDGAIFGQVLISPAHHAADLWERQPDRSELPELRSLADVLWGFWNRDNPNLRNIRYYVVNMVANEEACELIARALKNKEKEKITPWPGITFGTDTDEGKAILGSPVGATIAYFLMQHKAQLGSKVVTRVTILRDEGKAPNPDPHLFFHIEDSPPPEDANSNAIREVNREQNLVEWSAVSNGANNKSIFRVHKLNSFLSPVVAVAD